MRAIEFTETILLESLKTLIVQGIQVRIDMDHLINRMAQRGLFDRYREIDAMLRELPDHMSKIADIEPGQQFWLWDPKRKIGLGFRKVNTIPVLMLKTAVSSPPKGERNPVIVTEQLDVKTLSVKELAKKHNVPEKQIIDQLNKGMKVELEHTTDRKVAKEIALDHLKEFPDYYDRLAKAETNESASGYIPSNAQKNDPRYKTGLTKDVRPDSIQKNAKAFGFKTSRAGIPPLLRK